MSFSSIARGLIGLMLVLAAFKYFYLGSERTSIQTNIDVPESISDSEDNSLNHLDELYQILEMPVLRRGAYNSSGEYVGR